MLNYSEDLRWWVRTDTTAASRQTSPLDHIAQLRVPGQQIPQGIGQRQQLLPIWDMRKDGACDVLGLLHHPFGYTAPAQNGLRP
jgi:hypothetical protein